LEKPPQTGTRGPTKLWLPVVLAVGVLVGLALSYNAPEPFRFSRFVSPEFQEIYLLHTVLSTTSIALLVALTLIYVRVYAQTGARFALGITVVLFALLIQSLIEYPLILGFAGPFPGGQGTYLSFADVFTIAAYTIFLYLSLE